MNGKSELITHTLWKPPYKANLLLPPTLPEWYCVISELMETALMSEYSFSDSPSVTTALDSSELEEHTCIDDCSSHSSLDNEFGVAKNGTSNKRSFQTTDDSLETALEHSDTASEMSFLHYSDKLVVFAIAVVYST
ncbi:unnamed protein product [Gongylonema pulchrum]|uniref:Ovule protein n=1 Tax=Gongylonema pulchrum TaxID=637853 RepID=A0A183EXN8_9BILA|nr:unnamed protein product [Gongylonema pulchrum]